MKYWRCRLLGWTERVLWPLTGHRIRINQGEAFCDRCPWREPLNWTWADE